MQSPFSHYENLPMQYIENFFRSKNRKFHLKHFDIININAQNIDCGYTLVPPRLLTSTHNICFGSEQRKLDVPLPTPVYFLYKSGV